jgi:hypothetical protein
VVDYYRENGPSILGGSMLVHAASPFRLDGYLTLLVGMRVTYDKCFKPTPQEQKFWQLYCLQLATDASQAMDVREALNAIRLPSATWA